MYLVEFYYKLVKAGRLTIDEVPIKFRELVRERLCENEQSGNN